MTKANNKTQPTGASVERYLAAIEDDERRRQCRAVCDLMAGVTRRPPRLWGTSIVGFATERTRCEAYSLR